MCLCVCILGVWGGWEKDLEHFPSAELQREELIGIVCFQDEQWNHFYTVLGMGLFGQSLTWPFPVSPVMLVDPCSQYLDAPRWAKIPKESHTPH